MTIQDLASNPFITSTSPMIGFIPPGLLDEESLSLRIYLFVLEQIRIEDQLHGHQFLERYLIGPQVEWARVRESIRNLPSLSSVSKVDDEFLQYLKWIVGWTSELDNITDELNDETLRRLIAASVRFWKSRGTDDSIIDILRLTTGARVRIWNWFDFRIVVGEVAMTEDYEGFDPWMIELPGPPNVDENRYNIRIVDDGSLSRSLVRGLARLTRPGNERVEIAYLAFLDMFLVDDDNSQWAFASDPFSSGDSVSASTVTNNEMTVVPTVPTESAEAYVDVPNADDWLEYTVTWRARGKDWICSFYRTGNGDMYAVSVDTTANELSLFKLVGGVPAAVGPVIDMQATFGTELQTDVFYAIRVTAVPENGQTRIQVFFDAMLAVSELDPTHAEGSIGIGHLTNGSVVLSEAEIFFNPLESDTIDINS